MLINSVERKLVKWVFLSFSNWSPRRVVIFGLKILLVNRCKLLPEVTTLFLVQLSL